MKVEIPYIYIDYVNECPLCGETFKGWTCKDCRLEIEEALLYDTEGLDNDGTKHPLRGGTKK